MNSVDKINKRIDRIKNIILTIGFMVILIIPAVQVYIKVFPEAVSTENRKLADMPEIRLDYLDPFPTRFEQYFTDWFSLRNQLVSWNFYFSSRILNKSPLPDKVLVGKNKWLYLVFREFDEYRRTNQFTKEEIDKIVKEIVYRKQYLNTKNISLYLVIAPIKYSIYPEYLPTGLNYFDRLSRTAEIKNALIDNDINVLDLRDSLLNEKDKELLYYKTDNHWNNLGAFYASRAIINKIRVDYPEIPNLELKNYNVQQNISDGHNLASMVKLNNYFTDIYYKLQPKTSIRAKIGEKANYPIPKYFAYKNEYEMIFQTDNDSLPKMLFIRDSFGKAVIPYLSESFDRSVFIFDRWNYASNEHIVENENPDIVVYMVLESLWDGFLKGVDISNAQRKK